MSKNFQSDVGQPAIPLLPASNGSAHYVYRLKGGAIVHTVCREGYVAKRKHDAYNYPGIEAALYPGYQMPSGRFQICAHCQAPIWDAPNAPGERPEN